MLFNFSFIKKGIQFFYKYLIKTKTIYRFSYIHPLRLRKLILNVV